MNYTVVWTNSAAELESDVMHLIHQGWKPQGGVSVVAHASSTHFFQAMVKETPPIGIGPLE